MTEVALLDGGMGQELIRRSGGQATPLWSTQALIDRPGLVAEVHASYADAGATIATSNTYALHRDRLKGGESNHYAADGVDLPNLEDKLGELLESAMHEAQTVRTRGRVAGSIGPLAASYRPDLHPEFDVAVPLYAEVAHHIAPHCDVILFETVASLDSAKAALAAGRQTNLPVWLSFTVDDEDGSILRSGEAVVDAAVIGADADAVLINCTAPEVIPQSLDALAAAQRPLGAYANGFETITKDFIKGGTTADGLSARRDLGPEVYAAHALTWLDHGATVIGGCCEVGPAHIAELHRRLTEAGHTII